MPALLHLLALIDLLIEIHATLYRKGIQGSKWVDRADADHSILKHCTQLSWTRNDTVYYYK
jgi:hypothetical protein